MLKAEYTFENWGKAVGELKLCASKCAGCDACSIFTRVSGHTSVRAGNLHIRPGRGKPPNASEGQVGVQLSTQSEDLILGVLESY